MSIQRRNIQGNVFDIHPTTTKALCSLNVSPKEAEGDIIYKNVL